MLWLAACLPIQCWYKFSIESRPRVKVLARKAASQRAHRAGCWLRAPSTRSSAPTSSGLAIALEPAECDLIRSAAAAADDDARWPSSPPVAVSQTRHWAASSHLLSSVADCVGWLTDWLPPLNASRWLPVWLAAHCKPNFQSPQNDGYPATFG